MVIHYVEKTFHCPDIRCQGDEILIADALTNPPEVESFKVCIPCRYVTVRYDPILDSHELWKFLDGIGLTPIEED